MRLRLLFFLFVSFFIASCAYQVVPSQPSEMSVTKRLSFIQARLLLGQWSLAKEQLDQIDESDQGREYWRLLSLYWLSLDRYEDAILVHEAALLDYPDDDFILNNYGVLLGTKKHWVKACNAFKKAGEKGFSRRQTVQINLARCAIRQNDVKLAAFYLKQAKEIAELPLIGLMTELNLVLIQGSNGKARLILNNIQAGKKIARGSVHFDEFNCLSRHVNMRETDPKLHSSASNFICLNGSRY